MNAREQAIEVLDASDQKHRPHRDFAGNASCRCGWEGDDFLHHKTSARLDALLAQTQEEPCSVCNGRGHMSNMVCGALPYKCRGCCENPDCTKGRVPGAPLVILGPTLAHPTVRIPDDVPGWEGEILPAAYHDPMREPQVHNANEEPAK